MLSRKEISARLKAIADQRYDDRRTVTPETAFEEFGVLNKKIVALYDQLADLAEEVLK